MKGSSKAALSPVILGLLLVVLVVSVVVVAYVFLLGAQQGFNTNPTGVNAVVTSSLYSRDAKVGVYGDEANFTVALTNTLNTPQKGFINITNNGIDAQSTSFLLLPNQAAIFSLSQKLNATGIWTVKVTARGVRVSSYSFQVMPTVDEADYAVAQWHDQNFYRNLVLGAALLATVSFIVAVASLARKPSTIIRA
jgi:hypothetical protein